MFTALSPLTSDLAGITGILGALAVGLAAVAASALGASALTWLVLVLARCSRTCWCHGAHSAPNPPPRGSGRCSV